METPVLPIQNESAAQNKIILLMIGLMFLLTYFPLLSTGFTTNDDLAIASDWHTISPLHYAKEQGRIGFFFGTPLLVAPYLFDNPIYYNAIRFAGPALLLLMVFVFLRGIYRSTPLGALAVVLFLAFVQNNWNHNALTSYPLLINMLAIAFLGSVASFIKYLEKGGLYGLLAAALYFLSLSGEHFVLFFPVFVVIAAVHERARNGVAGGRFRGLATAAKKVLPVAAALFAYLFLYVAWRLAFPSQYEGNIPSASGLSRMINVVWTYSMSAFPGFEALVARQHGNLMTSYGLSQYDLSTLASELRVEWIVKSAITAYAVGLILCQLALRPRPTFLRWGLVISLVCVFLPNVLLSLTEKYRGWVEGGSTSFVHTYYSYIAIIFFLALFITWLLGHLQARIGAKRVLIFVVAALTAAISLVTDFNNYYVTQDERLSNIKWKVVDNFLLTKEFRALPNNSTILAPSLFSARGIVAIHPAYWSEYFSRRSGKKVLVTSDAAQARAAPTGSVVYMKYLQEPHTDNQFLIYAPIKDQVDISNGSGVRSNVVVVYSYGRNRKVNLVGTLSDGESIEPNVLVEGVPIANAADSFFAAAIDMSQQDDDFPSVTVRADWKIDVDNLVFSYYPDIPRLGEYGIELGEGFFGWEGADTAHKWSWSKGNASLSLTSRDGISAPVRISMKVATLCPRRVTVGAGTSSKNAVLQAGQSTTVTLDTVLSSGTSTLPITTTESACSPGTGDPRMLAFSISDISVTRRTRPQGGPALPLRQGTEDHRGR
ncbi:MAG: hypothetical protein WKF61_00160 [Luteimonas sp.]